MSIERLPLGRSPSPTWRRIATKLWIGLLRSPRVIALASVVVTLTACSQAAPARVSPGWEQTHAWTLAKPPASSANPVPDNQMVDRPHERPETPIGPVAYVLDPGFAAIYEFDFGRGRMLGPAPRITDPTGHVLALPGYPYVYGGGSPYTSRDECAGPNGIAIAEGGSGSVAFLPLLGDGTLGPPRHMRMPNILVTAPTSQGATTAPNHSISGPAPNITLVVCLGDGTVVAISQDQGGTSVAYSLDPNAMEVLSTAQLPGRQTDAAIRVDSDRFAVATNDGEVAELSGDLSILATTHQAGGLAEELAFGDGRLLLRTERPNLLQTFTEGTLATSPSIALPSVGGPVEISQASGYPVLVGNFEDGDVTAMDLGLRAIRSFSPCPRVFGLTDDGKRALVICRGPPSQLAIVDLATGATQSTFGGGDPVKAVRGYPA